MSWTKKDLDNPGFLNQAYYGATSVPECMAHGMWSGCPGCPVLERGDCDNPDAWQYAEDFDYSLITQ